MQLIDTLDTVYLNILVALVVAAIQFVFIFIIINFYGFYCCASASSSSSVVDIYFLAFSSTITFTIVFNVRLVVFLIFISYFYSIFNCNSVYIGSRHSTLERKKRDTRVPVIITDTKISCVKL